MQPIVFALQFRGRAEAVLGSDKERRARSTAPSQTLTTVLEPHGIRTRVEALAGDTAILESRVERFADGTFVEDGTITYGRVGAVTFETVGRGWVAPAPQTGWVLGGVVWSITNGTGRLVGARGLITSNFTVSADGEVVDDHVVRLYVPEE